MIRYQNWQHINELKAGRIFDQSILKGYQKKLYLMDYKSLKGDFQKYFIFNMKYLHWFELKCSKN